MDLFANLADTTIAQILQCLPFEQRVRASRVSKAFYRASRLVIARTKILRFDMDADDDTAVNMYQKLTLCQLSSILDLCRENLITYDLSTLHLDSIRTIPPWAPTKPNAALITEIGRHSCPNLRVLDFGCLEIENEFVGRLIRQCKKLESFTWRCRSIRFVLPDGLVYNSLKRLHCTADDGTLKSLVGKLPKLETLKICLHKESVTTGGLQSFFEYYQNLSDLDISFDRMCHKIDKNAVDLLDVPHFWTQRSLVSLRIDFFELTRKPRMNDAILKKVVQSFPELELLHLAYGVWSRDAVASISSMSKLRELRLVLNTRMTLIERCTLDGGIRALTACKELERLHIAKFVLSTVTVKSLIGALPDLRYLFIYNAQRPADIFRSFSGAAVGPRNLEIWIECNEGVESWKLGTVMKALEDLDKDGIKIRINLVD